MADTFNHSQQNEFKIYGYLRDVLNHEIDCHDIIKIIVEYYKQGFASFYDENADSYYDMKQIKFGDIVRTKMNAGYVSKYMVMNIKNELITVGSLFNLSMFNKCTLILFKIQ